MPQDTQLSPQDFAAKIRGKYPGAYDDIGDTELTSRILTKYPEYHDMVKMQNNPTDVPGAKYTPQGWAPGQPPPYPDVKGSVQPSNLGTIATGPPLMSMQPGLPSPAQVPENAERMQQGAAIGAPVGGLIGGGTAAIAPIGRALARSAIYGAAGKYVGGVFGPTGAKVGGTIGAVAGAVSGGKVPTSKAGVLEQIFGGTENEALAKKTADITDPSIESQDLISRMKKLVVPGQQPTAVDLKRAGDLTQAPMELLKSLDKFGDKLATNEINRRLLMGKIPGLR